MAPTLNISQMSAFDRILEEKVKLGKFQLKHLLILLLVDTNDGAQLVFMSFLMPILKAEWGITTATISVLTSVFYLGTSLGSFLTGKVGSSLALFIVSISFVFVQNVYQMAFVRLIYGIIYGFSLPLTTSMLSEITPMLYRGKGLVLINMFVSVGKIVGCLLAILCLNDFHSGNWRLMMFLSSFPSLIVFWGAIYVMSESARFLIASNQIEEGIQVLNKMIEENNPENERSFISEEERAQLQDWQRQICEKHRAEGPSPKLLLQGSLKQISIRMWICWFIENAQYFGQLVIMPFILGGSKKTFSSYIITIMGEIPSIFVSIAIIDTKGLGRKNSLTICFTLAAVMHFFTYYAEKDHMSLYAGIARFFMKLVYAMLYPLTTELYPTLLRTLGFGFCAGVGRMGSALIPYVIFGLLEWDMYSSFFIFGVISALAALSSGTLPYDTLGRCMDKESNKASVLNSGNQEENNDNEWVPKQDVPLINQELFDSNTQYHKQMDHENSAQPKLSSPSKSKQKSSQNL